MSTTITPPVRVSLQASVLNGLLEQLDAERAARKKAQADLDRALVTVDELVGDLRRHREVDLAFARCWNALQEIAEGQHADPEDFASETLACCETHPGVLR